MRRFRPPDREDRARAIGSLGDLPEPLARAFTPADDFAPIPEPGPSDWLSQHDEPGQTFADFKSGDFPKPGRVHRFLYLQPIGSFASEGSPRLEELERFAVAFFSGVEVRCKPPLKASEIDIGSRKNPIAGNRQLLTTDILRLLHSRLPADAYCMLGITMTDLYPEPSWNFVFGQASPRKGVGVYSFARYDPAFYGREDPKKRTSLLMRRSCKVLAHETGHMFNLAHCIHFHCVMNGSNHLQESDARPMHLCPVCLRKLHQALGFDAVERYVKLLDFWKSRDYASEVRWLQSRIDHIRGR